MTSKSTNIRRTDYRRPRSVDKNGLRSAVIWTISFTWDARNRRTAMPRHWHAAGTTWIPEDRVDCLSRYSMAVWILTPVAERPRTVQSRSRTKTQAGILLVMLFQATCHAQHLKRGKPYDGRLVYARIKWLQPREKKQTKFNQLKRFSMLFTLPSSPIQCYRQRWPNTRFAIACWGCLYVSHTHQFTTSCF
jgi:hypothetical protein